MQRDGRSASAAPTKPFLLKVVDCAAQQPTTLPISLEVARELLEEDPDVEASERFQRVCAAVPSLRRLAGHGVRPYDGLNI